MFIGHFALGFAGKRLVPAVPLVALFAAAQFADVIWPVLLLTGVEQVRIAPGDTAFTPLEFVSYPYSHSLLGLGLVGLSVALLLPGFRAPRRAGALLGCLIVSHWVLDWVTHRPDMPLYPGGPKYGLGLWNSVPATIAIETAMFVIGVAIYLGATRAVNARGRWTLWGLVGLILAADVANIMGPPPPSVSALIATAIVGVIVLLGLSWWADSPGLRRTR